MREQKVQLRIVAGSLRGRKVNCQIGDEVRPTPQMVREAFFSIMGNAIPGRTFYDVFAGTGAVGMEALSRGAREAIFIEHDARLATGITRHLERFGVARQGRVVRMDSYRWAQRWQPPAEPVNIFLSPPFADYQNRMDAFLQLLDDLKSKAAADSVLTVQAEKMPDLARLLAAADWDQRLYGRNMLLIWVKEIAE